MKIKFKAAVFTFMLIGIAIGGLFPTLADTQKIRIGTEGTWKPFSYQDAAGNIIGFEIDLVRAICEKAKVECEFVVIPFENIIPSLLENKVDAGASGFRTSAKRKKIVDFSQSYYMYYPVFSSCQHRDLKDNAAGALKNMSVGTQTSTSNYDFLKSKYPDLDLRGYKNVDDIWIDLKAGRLDLAYFGRPTTNEFLESALGKECVLIGDDVKDPEYYSDAYAIAIRKGDTSTKEALDRGIKAIISDGTFDQINAKYWPFSIKYTAPTN